MRIGFSFFPLAVGAILTFAVTTLGSTEATTKAPPTTVA
jgi:hypothetical protein